MNYVTLFFTGALLCNAIPHLVAGLQGVPFPTPFAKPRGVGESSPYVNFLWGGFNLCFGIFLLSRASIVVGMNLESLALLVGALALGSYIAIHFGKVRRNRLR
jgi:hypothetical protein